jgi:hypothetical protein
VSHMIIVGHEMVLYVVEHIVPMESVVRWASYIGKVGLLWGFFP